MKKLMAFILVGMIYLCLPAQKYIETFEEGMRLYWVEEYYEAYLRFRAASVLSEAEGNPAFADKSQSWLNKSAAGIQRQQVKTDSLMKATKKLTDAFYFWDGRLALAYRNGRYGYINKKGETVIDCQYEEATNFDEVTGYAQVVKSSRKYWLSPEGKEYPNSTEVSSLPQVMRIRLSEIEEESIGLKTLKPYISSGKNNYEKELNNGINLYHNQKFYDAYLRFNAVVVLAKNAQHAQALKMGQQLKDSSIYQIRQLFSQAETALKVAQNIRNAVYFYTGKYAQAFQHGNFYFIDQAGNEFTKLGRWQQAEQFDDKGFARVKDEKGEAYWLDTTGSTYKVAYAIDDLAEDITALDLRGTTMVSFPTVIFDHTQLEVLILDGEYGNDNNFHSIPTEIQQLTKLKFLSLQDHNIKTLPAEIGRCKNLIFLNLSFNKLSTLPETIGEWTNLIHLNLSGNQLTTLPETIGEWQHLAHLNLSSNQLITLPETIGEWQHLTHLNLFNNQLTTLPEAIGGEKKLTFLNLLKNQLTTLPEAIGELQNLITLVLRVNQLTTLPETIGDLQQLKSLDLYENQLTTLPETIGDLQKLRILDLSLNQLVTLPEAIGDLQQLTSLRLGRNQLKHLPEAIWKLKNLTILELVENQLTTLPEAIGELQHLTRLSLSKNQLTTLPETIGDLQVLGTLQLSDNQLTNLPETIGSLQNLETLELNINELTTFPETIGGLRNLTSLILFSNKLTTLPEAIGDLQNLTNLHLEANQLTTLPEAIGDLQNLTSLNLRDNQLATLPAAIGDLQVLRFLNLGYNQLTTLPETIGDLQNLETLVLSDNPLITLPEAIGELQNLKRLLLSENSFSPDKQIKIEKLLPNCKVQFTKIDYAYFAQKYSQERNYVQAYESQNKAIEEDSSNFSLWYGLSWYALFAHQPEEAIHAAQKTLELNPEAISVETNLALGYLLNNQWPEAKKIYQKWKGKSFPNDYRLCDEVFLQDIIYLEAAGITHPDFAKVKAMFK